MDDLPIKKEDAERIEDVVYLFRNKLENLYRIAYLQGRIDESHETRKVLA